jgi:uncharacterized protein (UPF0332 family)
MASKKDRLHKAHERLKTARHQWDRASVASWEPVEPAECVTNCFYALENAVIAAALAAGLTGTTRHWEKEELAAQLVRDGKLKTDVSDRLNELNSVRKDVQYGSPRESLREMDLEDLVAEVEDFLDEVDELVGKVEGA